MEDGILPSFPSNNEPYTPGVWYTAQVDPVTDHIYSLNLEGLKRLPDRLGRDLFLLRAGFTLVGWVC